MAKTLTVAAVSKLKVRSGEKRREVRDGASTGLYLIIQSSGHKSWALRFRRPGGKPGKLTLGSVDLSGRELVGEPVVGMPLSLPAARQLAAEVHRRRALGRDVVADVKVEKRRRRVEVADGEASSFAVLARHYVKEHAMAKTRRWRATARMLGLDDELEVIEGGLVDRWGDGPATAITTSDVHDVVDETRDDVTPGARRRRRREKTSDAAGRAMARTLSKMFGWLVEKRKLATNPCAGVRAPKPARPKSRVLSSNEIKSFWRAAGEERPEVSAPLRLLLLTGCRRDEIADARRSELSPDLSTLSLPGSRTKNHRDHVVPLSGLARELIAAVAGEGDHVFSTTAGRRPVQLGTHVKKRLDARMTIPPWTLHDLRRTCATGMARLRIAPHVIEAVLNHVSGAKAGVAGIYNQYAYEDEKRVALERWADHVAGVVSDRPANVVTMTRSAS